MLNNIRPDVKREALSQIRQKISTLRQERSKLEGGILQDLSRRTLIRGSLYEKYKACNKRGCKCTRGERHGPFLYLSKTVDGKSKMIFIKRGLKNKVTKFAKDYQRWRSLRAKIVRSNTEILSLIDDMEKMNTIVISDLEENNGTLEEKGK